MKQRAIEKLYHEVLDENHQLKNSIIGLTQRLKDYESKMMEGMELVQGKRVVYESHEQALDSFVSQMISELRAKAELEAAHSQLRSFMEEQHSEQTELIKGYRVTTSEQKVAIDDLTQQRAALRALAHQLSGQLEGAREEVYRLEKENSNLQKDKLIVQERGREALEEGRESFRREMLQYRDRVETESALAESKFQKQIEFRDRKINQMSKHIENMLDEHGEQDSELLTRVFSDLKQEYNLSLSLKQARVENSELRVRSEALEREVFELGVKLRNLQGEFDNTCSENERLGIERAELERDLMHRLREIAGLEKEKEELDEYYTSRWTRDYNRVREQLGRDMQKRLDDLEGEYLDKMKVVQEAYDEGTGTINRLQEQLTNLAESLRLEQGENERLREMLTNELSEIGELRTSLREADGLHCEEAAMRRVILGEAEHEAEARLWRKDQLIREEQEERRRERRQAERAIRQLESAKEREIAELRECHREEKTGLMAAFEEATRKAEFETQQRVAQDQRIREELQENYEKHMRRRDKEVRLKIEESEQYTLRMKVHWVEKFKELEKTIAGLREKHVREREGLEAKVEELKEVELRQLNSIVGLKKQLKETEDSGKVVKGELEQEREKRVKAEGQLGQMTEWAMNSQKEVGFHLQVRKEWRAEVEQLKADFEQEMRQVKKLQGKRVEVMEGKIRELETMGVEQQRKLASHQQLRQEAEQAKELRSQLEVKDAQILLLGQSKEYFEVRAKDLESKIGSMEFKGPSFPIFSRKVKRQQLLGDPIRFKTEADFSERPAPSRNKEQSRSLPRSGQKKRPRRYEIASQQKSFNLTSSKGLLSESTRKHKRVMSSCDFN